MGRPNKSCDIHLTRLYSAPLKDVWEAYTDPAKAQRWWGPRGFTLTTHRKDFKIGGSWAYTMHGPDGKDYPNWCEFIEIVKPEKFYFGLDQLKMINQKINFWQHGRLKNKVSKLR